MVCKLLSINLSLVAGSTTRIFYRKKLPRNLKSPRRSSLPPDFGVNLFLKKPNSGTGPLEMDTFLVDDDGGDDLIGEEENQEQEGDIDWEADELGAISSLFKGRMPQKPGNLKRERPLPLPLPYKIRPLGLPTPKKHIKDVSPHIASSRASICSKVYKNPRFLVNLAKQIKRLDPYDDVSLLLDDSAHLLRKGSLSLTIRELGHMGLPDRALQTFCWAQKQPLLYPDDRILASTIEVLARNQDLKVPIDLRKFTSFASKGVIESMVRGFIRGGRLKLAWKLLAVAKYDKRMLDPSVYAKLIHEVGKDPDKYMFVEHLLNDLGEREDLNLSHQDYTAVMKVCLRLQKFEFVERLFDWFKQSGNEPSVVMYTMVIQSRYSEERYREALALVWEMERGNCLFDLPAYRVVIKLLAALDDVSRAARYFSKLKEAGFSPTYDIYRNLMKVYIVSGRLAKCREIWKELEMTGFKLEEPLKMEILQLERKTRSGSRTVLYL